MSSPSSCTHEARIVQPGYNCWRLAHADRAALLIDGEAYFSALRRAARNAKHSIFIIGRDIDSRIPFPPNGEDDGLPQTLGKFLDALVRRGRHLQIYVLDWDFALLYALDREILPIYNLGLRTQRRLHFHPDDRHPPGASHHQKIVVLDDMLAFVGGIDLTKRRWDTPRHAPEEPLRCGPDGDPYPPFHDVQLMVEGNVAGVLGELARRRWQRATDNMRQPAQKPISDSLWPAAIDPDFAHIEVATARTEPAYTGAKPVREVLQLYLDGISAARRSIYLENQYFTSPALGRAIEQRLSEPNGPEIALVTRRTGSGWLEKNTMEVLRAHLIRRLQPADQQGRLRIYCPEQTGLGGECIKLHSKLMFADDRLLRVGSSNLNNRSMSVDTECDLAIEARVGAQAKAILSIRNRLLAEHLGVEPQDATRTIERQDSLIKAIEPLQGNGRTLRLLEPKREHEVDQLVPDSETTDPERPVDMERLVEEIVPEDERPQAIRRMLGITLALLLVGVLAAAWRWGPLQAWFSEARLHAMADGIERLPWTPVWILGLYVVASLTAMPITLLIVATALVFGPWTTFGYALSGSLLGGGITFAMGRALGRRAVRQIAGRRLNALSRRLGEGGVFAVMVLRILPVAPFTVINLVAGASHLRMRDFLIGSALGMAPGILAVSAFSDQLVTTINEPSVEAVALLALVVALVIAGAFGIRWWLQRHSRKRAKEQS